MADLCRLAPRPGGGPWICGDGHGAGGARRPARRRHKSRLSVQPSRCAKRGATRWLFYLFIVNRGAHIFAFVHPAPFFLGDRSHELLCFCLKKTVGGLVAVLSIATVRVTSISWVFECKERAYTLHNKQTMMQATHAAARQQRKRTKTAERDAK